VKAPPSSVFATRARCSRRSWTLLDITRLGGVGSELIASSQVLRLVHLSCSLLCCLGGERLIGSRLPRRARRGYWTCPCPSAAFSASALRAGNNLEADLPGLLLGLGFVLDSDCLPLADIVKSPGAPLRRWRQVCNRPGLRSSKTSTK
jgi:hypothetical protein